MSKFEFLGEWPEEARAAVEPSLDGLEWLVPAWCSTVMIRWAAFPEDEAQQFSSASCVMAYEYRWAKIIIRPCFLSDPPSDRRNNLIHELLHVFIGPLMEYSEQMAARFLKDDAPKFYEATMEELRMRNESATQDLSLAILGALGK